MTGICLCHGGAREIYERHMPNWREHFSQIITISPTDDMIQDALPNGLSEKSGPWAIQRMWTAALLAAQFNHAVVFEYDTLFFAEPLRIEPMLMLCSVVFHNDSTAFTAPTYGHSPWVASGETWRHIAFKGGTGEHGVPDRWLAAACQRAGVTQHGTSGAYSNDRHWDESVIQRALQAIRDGAPYVHGVKVPLLTT